MCGGNREEGIKARVPMPTQLPVSHLSGALAFEIEAKVAVNGVEVGRADPRSYVDLNMGT